MSDFYNILGVSADVPLEEIKRRYRFLAQAYHPDKFASERHRSDASEAFKRINEAFQTLGDSAKRAEYDRIRRTQNATPPPPQSPKPPPKIRRQMSMSLRIAAVLLMALVVALLAQLPPTKKIRPEISVAATPLATDTRLPPVSVQRWQLVERSAFLNKDRYQRSQLDGRKFPQQVHVYNEPLDPYADWLAQYTKLDATHYLKAESNTPGYVTITLVIAAGPKHIHSIETFPAPDEALIDDWFRLCVQNSLFELADFQRQL
jgi:curved DNA-binding protein CbpA